MMTTTIETEILIIGAGPAGLFGAYYAGFRGLSVCVMDALPEIGGQISALYPEKLIYDIAGFPSVRGQDLIDSLVEQASPFGIRYLLGHRADEATQDGECWIIRSNTGLTIKSRAIIITAGVGAISPRPLPGTEDFEGKGLQYFVPQLSSFDRLDVTVVGGGDSAIDWALAAVERARTVTLIHRRETFRAHAHSVQRLMDSPCQLILNSEVVKVAGTDQLETVVVRNGTSGEVEERPTQLLVAALGFKMHLGPLLKWGLEIQARSIRVDSGMRTNLPMVFAAGDVTDYEGKVKLIAVGFGEAATAVNNAAGALHPEIGVAPGHSSDMTPLALR